MGISKDVIINNIAVKEEMQSILSTAIERELIQIN